MHSVYLSRSSLLHCYNTIANSYDREHVHIFIAFGKGHYQKVNLSV